MAGRLAYNMTQLLAYVYRSPSTTSELGEPVERLLRTSQFGFEVEYFGPDEKLKVDDVVKLDGLIAFPGGPDFDWTYSELKHARQGVRDFVERGNHYLGICNGMYLAGDQGFGFIKETDSECDLPNAQVTTTDDSIIQIDWKDENQWIYFQEGACVLNFGEDENNIVLGRYSQSQRIVSTLTKFGNGWVGNIGVHPEADQSWCKFER